MTMIKAETGREKIIINREALLYVSNNISNGHQ